MGFLRFLSFSLVFLATTKIILSANAIAIDNVAELCTHTDYPILCKTIVKKNPEEGATAATKAAIHATILETHQAKSKVSKLMKSQPDKRLNLKVCEEVYDDALSNLVKSMKNLKDKSQADLKINLSAALTDFVTCDDGFTETPGQVSPLAKVNELLRKLGSNCLALADEVKN